LTSLQRRSGRHSGTGQPQEAPRLGIRRRRRAPFAPPGLRVAFALALACLGVLACDRFRPPLNVPADQRDVELAGIVQSVSADGSSVTLTDGSTIQLDVHDQAFAVGDLGPGALFLGGVNEPWFGYTSSRPANDCYRVPTRGRDDGSVIATELGVQFVKAPGFVAATERNGILDDPAAAFCLDREGQVTSYGKTGSG
jgi:hypothetical protein